MAFLFIKNSAVLLYYIYSAAGTQPGSACIYKSLCIFECFDTSGSFYPNIPGDHFPYQPDIVKLDMALVRNTQSMIKEFSDLLKEISKSIEDDNLIDKEESEKIRREWEDLKSLTESFVAGCEKGVFR